MRAVTSPRWTLLGALGALLCGCHAPVWNSGEVLRYEIPPLTRSFTVVLTGAPDALYALASFKIQGRELVGVPKDELVVDMRDSYFGAGSAVPTGGLLQQTRLGTYTFVYPYAPGQPQLGGTVELDIATTKPNAPVKVHVRMPRLDGARVLHVNLFAVSESIQLEAPPLFLAEAQAILDLAGIRIQVDSLHTLRGTGLSSIDTVTEPWEGPTGPLARLAAIGAARVRNGALNVYIVDKLPRGTDGVSLGAPGPPIPTSAYFGVVLRSDPAVLGWTFAHEVAHFLGLRHVRTVTPSGRILTDQLDDTEPDGANLMEHGTKLSPGQIDVLLRSALLQSE